MTAEQPDRLPPYNKDAEQSVLGSMMRVNSVIDDVAQILHSPELFYTDAHRKICRAILTLHNEGHPVDVVTLANYLEEKKELEEIGKAPYLAELWDAAPTAGNVLYYSRIVRDKGMVRSLIHSATEVLRDAYDQAYPADEMLESAERRILEIAQMGAQGDTVTLQEALKEAYDRLDARVNQSEVTLSGVPTGYIDMDEKTAGFQASELIIVAARPSVGKTAFAINLCRNIAVDNGHPVFFVSLEQSKVEIAERLMACQAEIDSYKLRKGTITTDDHSKLLEATEELNKARFFIDDTPGLNMMRIAANARRLKRSHDIKLVVIDYLQLIEPENKRESRQEQVANISRKLKHLARELKIPVISLAQLNRGTEDRQDHRPRLSDLRESGCLTGDTLVTLVNGSRVPICQLVDKKGFHVWALDESNLKLQSASVARVFTTGIKPVFNIKTRLGKSIRATGNHKFRTLKGWVRLDQLKPSDRIAIPRSIRKRTERIATALGGNEYLSVLSQSDVYWDEIVSIEPDGEEQVYDMTVPGPSNFVANDMIVHNSIEQDADTVMLLHRPDYYEPGQNEGVIEIIIGKQRNGPTGEVTLTYLKKFMRFYDFAVEEPFSYGGS